MDNKYFSVEEMNNLIENLELAFTDYGDKADTLISKCKEFQNDDSYTGERATVVKDLVGDNEVSLVNAQKDMQAKLLSMYKHAVDSFAEKVDSAPNARLDLETLDVVESDLKAIYRDVDTTCAEIENIAKDMKAKYGHFGHITVPNADPLRESLENLCGGYNPEAGFYYDLKQKFINWDEEECAYIESQLLSDEIEKANSSAIQANTILDDILNSSAGTDDNLLDKKIHSLKNQPKMLFDDGIKDTTSDGDSDKDIDAEDVIFEIMYYFIKNNLKKELDIFCENNSKTITSLKNELIFSYLQKRYNFTDEEMKYFKENQESALISLHLAIKYNTAVADEIHNKLIKMYYDCGQGYLDDAHRLLEQYNITDELKERIKTLETLDEKVFTYYDSDGTEIIKTPDYKRIAAMEVAAAALYESGKETEFVAGVLGNIVFEGGTGHIEDTNYTNPKDEKGYHISIEKFFEGLDKDEDIDEDKLGKGTKYDRKYGGEYIYELNNAGLYISDLKDYIDSDYHFDKIIGIGMCQWTAEDRLPKLIELYEKGEYTHYDMLKAEATMLITELSETPYNEICTSGKGTEAAENVARDFFDKFEIGADDTREGRATIAGKIYNAMEE